MELILRTENSSNFEWLKKIVGEENECIFKNIPEPRHLNASFSNADDGFHYLPKKIQKLLKFDKTDFIISCKKNNIETPLISIEITASAPLSQHIEQRMARMISAAELGIVPIYICPNYTKTEDKEYSFNKKYFDLFQKIGTINKLPCVLFNFPDKDGVLLNDEDSPGCPDLNDPKIKHLINFVRAIILESKKKESFDFNYFNNPLIKKTFSIQEKLSQGKRYNIESMGTCNMIKTENLFDYIKGYSELDNSHLKSVFENEAIKKILSREQSLIFYVGSHRKLKKSRLFAHSGDPYVGMLAAIDYAFCRVGKNVDERKANIIFIPGNDEDKYFEKVFSTKGYNRFWKKCCPFRYTDIERNLSGLNESDKLLKVEQNIKKLNKISHHLEHGCSYTKERPLKMYAHFCDMIIFKDSILTF